MVVKASQQWNNGMKAGGNGTTGTLPRTGRMGKNNGVGGEGTGRVQHTEEGHGPN